MKVSLEEWRHGVREAVEKTLEGLALGFHFNEEVVGDVLLWEADAALMEARFPLPADEVADLDDCVDFWVYLDIPGTMRLQWATNEGYAAQLPCTGDPEEDGGALAAEFLRQLATPDALG